MDIRLGAALVSLLFALSAQAEKIVYWNDFESGQQRPIALYYANPTYLEIASRTEPDGNRSAATGGSYWADCNHATPGAGCLHILAAWYSETTQDAIGRPGDLPNCDMLGGTWRARIRGQRFYLPYPARVSLWIQAFDPSAGSGEGRFVNLFYAGDTIDRQLTGRTPYERIAGRSTPTAGDTWLDTPWTDVEIPLGGSGWTCLGARHDKAGTYGCSSIDSVLSEYARVVDLGIVVLYGNTPTAYPVGYGDGRTAPEFWIDDVEIAIRDDAQCW